MKSLKKYSSLRWDSCTTVPVIAKLLCALEEGGLPLSPNSGDIFLECRLDAGSDEITVKKTAAGFLVRGGSAALCARGVGFALSGLEVAEKAFFRRLGAMIDCSRNRVPTVAYLKHYFSVCALMGQNTIMLYTENTFHLPDEPFFDYMRGGYTLAELRELDHFAAALGIELIACIQTLGHFSQVLRWKFAYDNIADTPEVLLADDPKSMRLIEKILLFWRQALRTGTIHLGFDEAHDLGRGKFLDRCGYEPASRIFLRHLTRVNALCRELGFERTIIWSDMLFRMTPGQGYYSDSPQLSGELTRKLPPGVQLCYWDYYHTGEDFYRKYIRKHREFSSDIIVASGVWTWGKLWCDIPYTEQTALPCIQACLKENVKDLIFTMWGDDGAFCQPDSSLAGLLRVCNAAFGENDSQRIVRQFQAIAGKNYTLFAAAGHLESTKPVPDAVYNHYPAALLWDDPLLAVALRGRRGLDADCVADTLIRLEKLLAVLPSTSGSAPELAALRQIVIFLQTKLRFRLDMETAYRSGDRNAALMLARGEVPLLQKQMKRIDDAMRSEWLAHAKPFGLEILQRRNATQIARLRECAQRLSDWGSEKIPSIPELEASIGPAETGYALHRYRDYSSGSVIQ